MTDTHEDLAPSSFATTRKRLDWKLVVLLVLFHLAVLYGLARLLVPELTASVVEQATSAFTVTVRTYDEAEPVDSPPSPDEGAAGEEGREATPRAVTAPDVPLPRPSPAPRASSTGAQDNSGARADGDGTGAGGSGSGTGSGRGGSGTGGAVATRPTVRSGRIDAARDFPIPAGGREVRYGTSVTVTFTVGVDGRASDCSVTSPGPDPATNALVCPLVVERIRFNPATDRAGNPVPARYGWRQDFTRR